MTQTQLQSSAVAARGFLSRRRLRPLVRALIALLLLAVLLLSLSCGGPKDAPTGSPTAPSSQPAPTSPPSPSISPSRPPPVDATPTLNPQPPLDPLVRALQSRDWAAIQPLLQERPEPCLATVAANSESPLCPVGSPPGTPVQVFPAAGCHRFMSAAELEGQFSAKGDDLPKIYAIYRSSTQHPRVARLPAGDLGIILDRGNLGGQIFTVSGAQIVSADFGCGIPPRDLAALVPSSTFLVRPPAP